MKSNRQLKYSNYAAFSHVHGVAVNNSGLVFTDESIQLLKDVIDDEDIMLDFRLSGDRKVDGNLMFLDIDAVKEFYEDYVAAGGTKQDLSEVANSFPCEVKDID